MRWNASLTLSAALFGVAVHCNFETIQQPAFGGVVTNLFTLTPAVGLLISYFGRFCEQLP